MGPVERAVVKALVDAIKNGAQFVPGADLVAVARDAGGQGKAAEFAVDRLNRRGLIGSVWEGTRRIGYVPTKKAYEELAESH
jgi:hypothetical protein